jgi:hypothetical protein
MMVGPAATATKERINNHVYFIFAIRTMSPSVRLLGLCNKSHVGSDNSCPQWTEYSGFRRPASMLRQVAPLFSPMGLKNIRRLRR